MANTKASKIFRVVLAVLVFGILIVLVIRFGKGLMINDSGLGGSFDPQSSGSPYKKYESKVVQAAPGSQMYYFRLENLAGALSASMAGNTGGTYYNITIVLGTASKANAEKFESNTDLMASIIRDTMAEFRPDDLMNERGKEYLKTKIKDRVVRTMKIDNVDAVYFEQFLFQSTGSI